MELPEHLKGREVGKGDIEEPNGSRFYCIEASDGSGAGNYKVGVIENFWHVLTEAQQRAIIMASIMEPTKSTDITQNVRLWGDGDISFYLTAEQQNEASRVELRA